MSYRLLVDSYQIVETPTLTTAHAEYLQDSSRSDALPSLGDAIDDDHATCICTNRVKSYAGTPTIEKWTCDYTTGSTSVEAALDETIPVEQLPTSMDSANEFLSIGKLGGVTWRSNGAKCDREHYIIVPVLTIQVTRLVKNLTAFMNAIEGRGGRVNAAKTVTLWNRPIETVLLDGASTSQYETPGGITRWKGVITFKYRIVKGKFSGYDDTASAALTGTWNHIWNPGTEGGATLYIGWDTTDRKAYASKDIEAILTMSL